MPDAPANPPVRRFADHAVFDWSGQAVERPRGIAAAIARADGSLSEFGPDAGWSRGDVLDWLALAAARRADLLVGLDLGTALPFVDCDAYFPGWDDSPADAPALWAMVDTLCAADPHFGAMSFVAHKQAARYFRHRGTLGDRFGAARAGRLRVTEIASRDQGVANPYSNFNLVGAAQVGKSSLTGMRLLNRLRGLVPVWPFDPVPDAGPMIVEIYTSIAALAAGLPRGRSKMRDAGAVARALAALDAPLPPRFTYRGDHAADALVTAVWLRRVHAEAALWQPPALTATLAATEGWTFGVR